VHCGPHFDSSTRTSRLLVSSRNELPPDPRRAERPHQQPRFDSPTCPVSCWAMGRRFRSTRRRLVHRARAGLGGFVGGRFSTRHRTSSAPASRPAHLLRFASDGYGTRTKTGCSLRRERTWNGDSAGSSPHANRPAQLQRQTPHDPTDRPPTAQPYP
jgi:hypothetical protein